jgi:hypothetical protein
LFHAYAHFRCALVNLVDPRSFANVTSEWALIALAYNCRRLHRMRQA